METIQAIFKDLGTNRKRNNMTCKPYTGQRQHMQILSGCDILDEIRYGYVR